MNQNPITNSFTSPVPNTPNPMFAKFDQVLGVQTPTTSEPKVTSRADEIRALAKPPPPGAAGVMVNSASDITNKVVNNAKDFGKNVSTDFQSARTDMGNVFEDALSGKQGGGTIGNLILNSLGVGSKLGLNIIGDAIKPLMGDAWDALGKPMQDSIHQGVSSILNSKLGQEGVAAAKIGGENYNNWKQKNPDFAKNLESVVNIGGFILAAQPIVSTTMKAGEAVVKATPDIIAGTKEVVGGATQGVKDLATGAKNAVSDTTSKIKGLTTAKTQADILATPEADVYKLSPPERKMYFDNQQEQITAKSSAAEAQVKTNLQTKSTASQTEAENLNRQLAVASRDEVIKLRPQIRSAMAEQSATYRNLVDEAIAPVKDTPIKAKELSSFVDSRYSENPDMANVIKDKLGLSDKTTTPLIGKSGKFEVPTGDTTLGKIYEQAKSLKQDISAGAKNATKTFTADDKITDDAISTLSDYMKSKGVDLSEANKFWSKYAPIRNQLVSEAKPFLQVGTQTKTFANTLTRVIQGRDVNNENFIKEVEGLVGKPIAKDTRDIVSKLSANEKQAVADEIAAQEQKAQIALEKEQALKGLSDKQFEVERRAYQRNIVKKIIYTAGGIGIDKIVKHYTGIGI